MRAPILTILPFQVTVDSRMRLTMEGVGDEGYRDEQVCSYVCICDINVVKVMEMILIITYQEYDIKLDEI